jgi:hypothetical protein
MYFQIYSIVKIQKMQTHSNRHNKFIVAIATR